MVVPAAPALAAWPPAIGLDASSLDTAGSAYGVQIADVTGDGLADLIVTTRASSDASAAYKVLVYRQQADGTLATSPDTYGPSAFPTTSDAQLYLATGDLNADGLADVAIGLDAGVDVFLQSAGALSAPNSLATSGSVHGIQIADLNGDGLDDLIYAVAISGGYKYVRRFQKLDHSFAAAVQIGAGSGERFTVGDVNGDGKPDVVVEDPSSGLIPIFVHDVSDQGFTESDETRVAAAVGVRVADVNGDAIDDLLVLESGDLVLLAGEVGGTLADPVTIAASPSQAFALEVADVNGDARQDAVVFAAARTDVLLQDGSGVLQSGCPFPTVSANRVGGDETVALGDLGGDGLPDAVGAAEAAHVGLLTQLASSDTTPSTVGVSASPTTVQLDQPITVAGELRLQTGGCADRVPVELWRKLSDGSESMIATAPLVSEGDGTSWSFTFDDPAPALGTVQYRAVWSGDAFHDPGSSAYVPVTVTKKATSIGLSVSDATLNVGDSTKLIARLTGGGDPRTVEFYAVGRSRPMGSVVAGSAGRAELSVSPAAGTTSYYARYAGDAAWASSKSANVDVTVHKLSTSIRLAIGRTKVVYGGRATLTAHLRGGSGTRRIGFYSVGGGHRRLIDTVRARPDGTAKLVVEPRRNTIYRAEYAGASTWARSISNLVHINVAVRVTGKTTRFMAKKNGVAVYNCCRAYYFFKVAPSHAGTSVPVRVEYYASGWHSLGTQTFKLGRNSSAEIYINVKGGIGYLFRARACFPADADHLGGCADYSLFRYRKKP
jgi:Bacterial Ig-like domain (group 3)/FG-GAP-like repeat